MALGTIHILAEGRPCATLVMCPSHITQKWAREVLLTIPRAHTFLIEDMRNGGDHVNSCVWLISRMNIRPSQLGRGRSECCEEIMRIGHFALSMRMGTLILCRTLLAVLPRNKSARRRWP